MTSRAMAIPAEAAVRPEGPWLRLGVVAVFALVPFVLSSGLWITSGHRGFLAVALLLAVTMALAYFSLRSLVADRARAAQAAECAQHDLTLTRQHVSAAFHAVDSSAAGLDRGNRNLSERTQGQASAIEQAAASIEELAASVDRNTGTARETQRIASLAGEATSQVRQSAEVVDQVAEVMAAINGRVNEVKSLMNAIVAAGTEQSGGIAQVGEAMGQMERATRQNSGLVGGMPRYG